MKVVISDTKKCAKFTILFQYLKQFTTNLLLYFREESMYIQCLDDSHCCLFEADLKSGWFQEYVIEQPKTIGINLNMFHRVLNARHESQSIELTVNEEEEEDNVYVNFINGTNNNFNKYFELSLVNIESELMNVTKNDTLVDLHIETKTFCDMINQFMIFDDKLTITFNEDQIDLQASGTDGKMRTEIKLDDVKEYVTAENITLTQSYSLRYINMMCHFNKLSGDLYMGFSDTMPMLMTYDLGDDSYLNFHLAPKIIDDED
jgi:proliferating cell nuclear antigen PCNA